MLLEVVLPCVVYGLFALMAVLVLLDFRQTRRQALVQVELARRIHAQQARVLEAVEALPALFGEPTNPALPLWCLAGITRLTDELQALIKLGRMAGSRKVSGYLSSPVRVRHLKEMVDRIEQAKDYLIQKAALMRDPIWFELGLNPLSLPYGCGIDSYKNMQEDQTDLKWFIKRYEPKPGQGALAWHWRYMFG